MKKFILAIVQCLARFVVRTLMFITPARIQIHVFERFIAALDADRKFHQNVADYTADMLRYRLCLSEEKPEVPDLVKLYNAFVFAHETLSSATPARPNEKRKTFQKIPTL